MCIEERNINGKPVYIFPTHNIAPIAWSKLESRIPTPALLTLDHHTDTHLAFLRFLHSRAGNRPNQNYRELVRQATIECTNIRNQIDIQDASINRLRNDEQIDFAIRSGIISHAYVISHDTNSQFEMRSEEYSSWFSEKNKIENIFRGHIPARLPDRTYIMPENKIISLSNNHLYENLDIQSEREKFDLSIEDENLSVRIDEISRINESLFPDSDYDFRRNFILDIDLDYFNTEKSINPDCSHVFYELIRRSRMITIATEPWYVNDCRLEGESFDVDYLLSRLIDHIEHATAQER